MCGRARRDVLEALDGGFRAFACGEGSAPARAADAIVLCAERDARLGARVDELARSHPDTPIVVVVERVDRREIRAALAARAKGIVSAQSVERTLTPCVRAVVAGQLCVPDEHSEQLLAPALSAREKQVLGLLVMGYMNSQIAERLFLAESTVKSHLHSAFGKLGVRSRHEAVDTILDPERGLGLGILGVGAEPVPIATGSSA